MIDTEHCRRCGIVVRHDGMADPDSPWEWWADIEIDAEGNEPGGLLCGECNGAVIVLPTGMVISPEVDCPFECAEEFRDALRHAERRAAP